MKFINNILLPLNNDASRSASCFGVYFLQRVLVQNYFPEPYRLNGLNNSEVTFTASIQKVLALCYNSQLMTVIFSLKAKEWIPLRVRILGNR